MEAIVVVLLVVISSATVSALLGQGVNGKQQSLAPQVLETLTVSHAEQDTPRARFTIRQSAMQVLFQILNLTFEPSPKTK